MRIESSSQFQKILASNHDPESRPVLFAEDHDGRLAFLTGKGLCLIPKADHGVLLPELALDENLFMDHVRGRVLRVAAGKGVTRAVKVSSQFVTLIFQYAIIFLNQRKLATSMGV